jgi:hypothetical protein
VVALVLAGLGLLAGAILSAASSAGAVAPVTLPDLRIVVPTDLISIAVDPSSGVRQLRFTHITADVGAGPFEIDPTYDAATGTSTFVQAIYRSPQPGVWVLDHTVPVAATGNWDPPTDYRFPLTRFTLNGVNQDGSLGATVATSPKTDYCITGDVRIGGPANTPDQTFIPPSNCSDPTKPLGWSVGWGDQYDQTDAGQPIDLTGIPNGIYILHAIVDPRHVLTESNTANNITDTVLRIERDRVTVLSQSNPSATAPTVALTSPAAGATVSGSVTLRAAASAHAPATVASVQFLIDGQPLGRPVLRAPYSYSWTVGSTTPGEHLLSAQATDSQGNLGTAPTVAVNVARAPAQLQLRSLSWRRGVLTLRASGGPNGAALHVELDFPHGSTRELFVTGRRLRLRTPRPRVVVLRAFLGARQQGRAIRVNLDASPTVRITNPVPSQTVSGVVRVAADARDGVAVSFVQFSLDGKPLGGPVTAPPYGIGWNTKRVKPGRHTLSVRATNPIGNSATASVIVTVQNPASPMTCFVLQAHLNAHGHGVATTSPFHTAMAGETLVAFVSADGPSGAGQQTATVSGAGLTWRLVKRVNARSGDSEIWTARAPGILTGAQVTASLANPGFDESLTVIAIEGVKRVGAVAGAAAASGAPSLELKTSSATSLVFAVGTDWDRAVARVLPTGFVLLDQWLDQGAGNTFWTQYTNQPTGLAGTVVTVAASAPTNDQWNLAAVELVNSD